MTPRPPNYYEVLGVAPTATDLEVKRAARCRRIEVHPDRRGEGSISLAQEVGAAADVLCNARLRKAYDAEHRYSEVLQASPGPSMQRGPRKTIYERTPPVSDAGRDRGRPTPAMNCRDRGCGGVRFDAPRNFVLAADGRGGCMVLPLQ